MMRAASTSLIVFLCAAGVAAAAPQLVALEEEEEAAGGSSEESERESETETARAPDAVHHHRFHLGVLTTGLSVVEEEGRRFVPGPGAFLTVVVIPGWLELELVGRALFTPEGIDVPFDLLVKKSWHVHPRIHPFIGLGPAVAFERGREVTKLNWGGASVAGLDVWLDKRVGVVIEANYNLIVDERALVHELGMSAGAMIAW